MGVKFLNNSFTVTAVDIDEDDTEIIVVTGTGILLPAIAVGEYFYATLRDVEGNEEIVKVTALVDDTLTAERGAEGTLAMPFIAGSLLENRITAQTLRDATEFDYLLL